MNPVKPTIRGQRLNADLLERIMLFETPVIGGPSIAVTTSAQGRTIARRGAMPGRPIWFWAEITAANPTGVFTRWQYGWREVVLETDTNEGWTEKQGGRSDAALSLAWNICEVPNSTSGVQGNGVNIDTLPGGFSLQPAPVGAIVAMNAITLTNGSEQSYWFEHLNAVDGVC